MLLTFLSRLMSSLLTTLLFVTVVGMTANQTILNTKYIESKLASQNAYNRLSDALSKDISDNSAASGVPQSEVSSQLKTVLTPDLLKQKIDSTLTQLQTYYRGKGPLPTIDFSSQVQQVQSAGVPLDAGKYNQPVKLTAASKAKRISDAAKYVGIGLLALMAVLFASIFAIAIKRRDYRPLGNIVFSLGLMLTITGGSMLFVPAIFNKLYKFNPVTNPFGSLAHDLAIAIIHDYALRLLIIGVVALLVGILAKFLLHKQRQPKNLAYAKAETPTMFDKAPTVERVSIADAPTTPEPPKADVVPGAPAAPPAAPQPRKRPPRLIQ
jgi:hypothetical protein